MVQKRREVKQRAMGMCERCHENRMDHVHHLTYERLYNELLEDLQGLCADCHKFLSGKSSLDPMNMPNPDWDELYIMFLND